MIVRRLCVTPAVGSLMQWLLISRNRTAYEGAGAAISGRPFALFLELPSRQPDRGGRQQHQRRGLGNATGGAA